MMHSRQLQYDHSLFLKDLAPLLSEADLAIANAEFTLAGPPYTGYPAFSAPDGYKNSILDAGVDVLLTANNHILDRGSAGLERTLKQYDCFAGSVCQTDDIDVLHGVGRFEICVRFGHFKKSVQNLI